MNFKKIFISVAATLALGTVAIESTSKTVNALPSVNTDYWFKPRKMITTKNQQLLLINGNKAGYQQTAVKKKTLKKGSLVTVKQSASWPWIFSGNIPGIGSNIKNGYFWVNMNHSTNWLKKYSKQSPKVIKPVNYKSYSYWFKKDDWLSKPRKVELTKNIKIRKIVWAKNSIKHHLGRSKTLKKGTHIKILANNPTYCWSLFGKYKNWVYPHKTVNWFK